MENVVLVIHLMVSIAMVAVILLQRSEGGALGIGGGGGGGGFMTGRSAANLLTRTTAVLAVAFFVTSITLTVLAGRSGEERSIIDRIGAGTQNTPAVTTEKKAEGDKADEKKAPAKQPAKKPEGPSTPTSD